MGFERNRKPNDCAVCSTMNALNCLGIEVDREEIEKLTRYDPNIGAFAERALIEFAKENNLEHDMFPHTEDLIWTQVSDRIKKAYPEDNKILLFEKYKERLEQGMIAVISHRWENSEMFHSVLLYGVKDGLIKVFCSLKGDYLADEEFFHSQRNQLNGALGTFWIRRKDNEG